MWLGRTAILKISVTKLGDSLKNDIRKQLQSRKPCISFLPFKGNTLTDIIYHRLFGTVDKTFHATKLQIRFASKALVQSGPKFSVPHTIAPFGANSVTCSCGAAYTGRTSKLFPERVREHHLAWWWTRRLKLSPVLFVHNSLLSATWGT